MADDIVTRLRQRAWDGAEWDETLTAAADEIERLRGLTVVRAPYPLTLHTERKNGQRTGLELHQDADGWWSILLFVDGAYSERERAKEIARDVWSVALADACRILNRCYAEGNYA